MPTNGNKVSQKELYAAIIAQSEERQEMERRLGDKMDMVIGEIRKQNIDQGERLATIEQCAKDHAVRLKDAEGGLDTLRATDRRWGALGAVLGPVFGGVAGYFAGRQ